MDTITILRELTRHRILLTAACLLAVLAGAAVLYKPSFPPKSRDYNVGVASTSVLLDTPSSQVVEVAPRGSDTLGTRANLLASLMVDGDVKAEIAHNAGLNPSDLVGNSSSVADQSPTAPNTPNAPELTTQVITDNNGAQLPIIQIQTQAPTATTAGNLANAAVTGLRDYLNSTAAAQRIPDAQRLKITSLGTPQAHTATRGPTPILALGAALLILALACTTVLTTTRLIRNWRTVAASDQQASDQQASDQQPSAQQPSAQQPRDRQPAPQSVSRDERRLPFARHSRHSAGTTSGALGKGSKAEEPQVGTA